MSAYLSRPIIEACVEKDVTERTRLPGINYHCRFDAAGGTVGNDSFAGLICHRSRDNDRDLVICDTLFEVRPPFDPLDIIARFAGILKQWDITQVTGDGWSFNFVASAFAKFGIAYNLSKLSASELYIAALPSFTSKSVVLLDQPRAIDQLVNLRRKIGSAGAETVTHMRGQHDDLANVIAGGIYLCTPREQAMPESFGGIGVFTGPRVLVGYPGYGTPEFTAFQATLREGAPALRPAPGERSIHAGDAAPLKGRRQIFWS